MGSTLADADLPPQTEQDPNVLAATIAEAMLNLIDCWVDPQLFDSRLEFAMRTWALTDPGVDAALVEADAQRLAAITALFERFSYDATEADTRARTLYLTQVGYIALRSDESFAVRMARIPAYVLTFSGVAPSAAEVAAFRARHQARSDAAVRSGGQAGPESALVRQG
ncbi:MAG: hypothetical protein EAZ40_18075 [Rhodobacterales bacterium]|nr:MAG: hypothetical protein EAZ40_18075 [Rhodobacterales bacterium]